MSHLSRSPALARADIHPRHHRRWRLAGFVLGVSGTFLAAQSASAGVAGKLGVAGVAGVAGIAGVPLLSTSGAGAGAAGDVRPRAVDTAFHGLWTIYDDPERAAVLDRLRDAGVRSVRMDLSWVMLQPDGPASYYPWGVSLVDSVVGMANQRGIRPLITLWLTPGWANGNRGERALPDNPADYARVAHWAAARWRGKVAGWEIWNEPNDPAYLRDADPAGYARLLRTAYPAIKDAAPETPVVFGGVEYNDTDWIGRAYDAGAAGAFDVMATHPYQGIADLDPSATDGTKWTLMHAGAVHQLMVERGDGAKPIWFTEFGWSTHGDPNGLNWLRGVSEARQAMYLSRTAELVGREMPYVTRMYWSADRDVSFGDVQYRNYGLFRRDLTAKPAFDSLAAVNAEANGG